MSLSAGRDLQPLVYSCPSGTMPSSKLAGHRNVNTDSHSTLQDAPQQATAKGKPLLMSPRRRRELETDELEAEHRAETWTKVADEADETRVQVDKTEAHAKAIEADDTGSQIDVVNKNHDADEREIADDTSTLETKEMTTENLDVVNKGKERELLSEQDEEREMTDISNEKEEEEATNQMEKPDNMGRDEATKTIEETCEEDPNTLLSKVFDDDGFLRCCRSSLAT